MPLRRLLILSCLAGLCLGGGCRDKQPQRAADAGFSTPAISAKFFTLADAEQLGQSWPAGKGPRAIYTSRDGKTALLCLHGEREALWLQAGPPRLARLVALGQDIVAADMQAGVAYALDGFADFGADVNVLASTLPDGNWEQVLTPQQPGWGDCEILAVATSSAGGSTWVLGQPRFAEPGLDLPPAVPTAPEELPEGVEPPPHPQRYWLAQLGEQLKVVKFSALDPSGGEPQLVVLPGGEAVVGIGASLYLADSSVGSAVEFYNEPSGREFSLSPDATQAGVWMHLQPQVTASGTGREASGEQPGILRAVGLDGKTWAEMLAGKVRLGRMLGDMQKQRCLFVQGSAGAMLADIKQGRLSWLLRPGGVPLFGAAAGSQLWALLPDKLVGIETDTLIQLAPNFAASQTLPREALQPCRDAVEALGWNWETTQLSPLVARDGRLSLFDTSDPDSSFAELDWSATKQRAQHVLVARLPRADDLVLFQLAPQTLDERLREKLRLLGWTEPRVLPEESITAAGELRAAYEFGSTDGALQAGRFEVWLTADALLISLDPATDPLPADALSVDEAKEAAKEIGLRKLQAPDGTDPLLSPDKVQAGWLRRQRQPLRLQPDDDGQAIPAYEVELRVGADGADHHFSVLLDARDGGLIELEERGAYASAGR